MARRGITITYRETVLNSFVGTKAREAALRAANTTKARAQNNISQAGRYDTGEMTRTMTVADAHQGHFHPRFAVGSPAKHVKFQEFGTRGHGPVTAKVLRFKPKGSNTFVFTTWVWGVKPARFMKRALRSITVYDFLP